MSRPVRFGGVDLLKMRLPTWRSRFVVLILLVGFGGLLARAGWLQLISNDFLKEQGAKRMERTLPLKANRGSVLDRNKVVLAKSVPAHAIWFDGKRAVNASDEQLEQLARVLGRDSERLIKRVRSEARRFVYLDRQVDPDVAEQVRRLKARAGFVQVHRACAHNRPPPWVGGEPLACAPARQWPATMPGTTVCRRPHHNTLASQMTAPSCRH